MAPLVSISSPTNGQNVSGSIAATASASDNVAVTGVQFLVDGQNYGSEDTAAPYSITIGTTALSNGSHTIAARARDAAGNAAVATAVSVTVSNTNSFTPIRINAGGPAYTDPNGLAWSADTGYSGGAVYKTSDSIANTNQAPLYQTERYDSITLQYLFTVPTGRYIVKLKFAEIHFSQSGQRVFDAVINGATVLNDYDIVRAIGGPFKAIDKTFLVDATTGSILIQLLPVVQNPKINAIEIVKAP
jgi:hypothetical protein